LISGAAPPQPQTPSHSKCDVWWVRERELNRCKNHSFIILFFTPVFSGSSLGKWKLILWRVNATIWILVSLFLGHNLENIKKVDGYSSSFIQRRPYCMNCYWLAATSIQNSKRYQKMDDKKQKTLKKKKLNTKQILILFACVYQKCRASKLNTRNHSSKRCFYTWTLIRH